MRTTPTLLDCLKIKIAKGNLLLSGGRTDLADFPAVFYKLCHGKQQAVVTAIRGCKIFQAEMSLFDQNILTKKAKYPET